MKIKVSKSLSRLPKIDYRNLKELQGNLKDLSSENYQKLLKSFKEFGFIVPLFIWKKGREWMIVDAHQRCRVLNKENIEPYELPYVEIEAKDEAEAKKKLLVISSQYGKITQEGYDEFTAGMDDVWLSETANFDSILIGSEESIPEDNKEIDETELAKTKNECPKCNFKW
jgi:hypothetical protein